MTMSDSMIGCGEVAADFILFHLAVQAGVGEGDKLSRVEETHLENYSSSGAMAMEAWTVFHAYDQEGQAYAAHLPGRLDDLIVRTVRDLTLLLEEE